RIAEWALEAAPESVRAGASLAELDIAFQNEATVGQTVVSACGPAHGPGDGGSALGHHVFRDGPTPQTVALARTRWT
ncbi:MAG TPA: hypothetical protein VF594_05735, partial [Rubricoccaceae bacterium]